MPQTAAAPRGHRDVALAPRRIVLGGSALLAAAWFSTPCSGGEVNPAELFNSSPVAPGPYHPVQSEGPTLGVAKKESQRLLHASAGSFEDTREARVDELTDAGWEHPLAVLIAFAEVPWPDVGKFSSAVWVQTVSLNQAYLSAPSVSRPNPRAAIDAIQGYLRIAESVGAVGWATHLRRALQEALPWLSAHSPDPSLTVTELVPLGTNVERLEHLRRLLEDGCSLPKAAARAFLAIPWLDGVQVSPELARGLQSKRGFHPTGEDGEERNQLQQLREVAMECDAPDYVAAVDILLDALPEDDGEEELDAGLGGETDPLAGLDSLPDFLEAAAWMRESESGDSLQALRFGRHGHLDVDYASSVPRSLFDPSGMAHRQLAEEAFIATGSTTLMEAVEYAASSASPRLRRVLEAARWSRPMPGCLGFVQDVRSVVEAQGERMSLVLKWRLLADEPATLSDVGDVLGLTRERVRQLQRKLEESLSRRAGYAARLATVLREALGDMASRAEFDSALRRAVPGDDDDVAVRTARWLVAEASGYQVTDEAVTSSSAADRIETFASELEASTDDRGFVDEDSLWGDVDVEPAVREALIRSNGLVRICGFLMRRDTQKCRVYAAFRSLGEPVTVEEVDEQLGDLAFEHISNVLSAAPDIVKATKDQWALLEWVDRPYQGIAEEIAYRIEQAGGVTTVEALMTELQERYRVARSSIHMYLGTPRFDVQDGEVRLVAQPRSRHTPLERISSVVFSPSGTPVLTVRMEDRYLSGYSVNVPQAVADYLGVGIGENSLLPVKEPEACEDVSVIWRSDSVAGPHIGRVRQALTRLGVRDGDRFYIELDRAGLRFMNELPFATDEQSDEAIDDETEASVAAVIERMKARRQL